MSPWSKQRTRSPHSVESDAPGRHTLSTLTHRANACGWRVDNVRLRLVQLYIEDLKWHNVDKRLWAWGRKRWCPYLVLCSACAVCTNSVPGTNVRLCLVSNSRVYVWKKNEAERCTIHPQTSHEVRHGWFVGVQCALVAYGCTIRVFREYLAMIKEDTKARNWRYTEWRDDGH